VLEPPDIQNLSISHCLNTVYGLSIAEINFLPIGADMDTAVYRAIADAGQGYFVKLRRGKWNKASVLVPNFLAEHGLKQVISPIRNINGDLWSNLATFAVTVYPFIDGSHGYEQKMSPTQWESFGKTVRSLHDTRFPLEIVSDVPTEGFTPRYTSELRTFLSRCETDTFDDLVSKDLAALLVNKKTDIESLIENAEILAQRLRLRSVKMTLCHADLHCWNLLIDRSDNLFIVDWDTLIFAPKERDLMFVGAGLADSGYLPEEEKAMFFSGYGSVKIDQDAVTYYRCARIVEDLSIYCQQVFLSSVAHQDREMAVQHVKSMFDDNGACASAIRH